MEEENAGLAVVSESHRVPINPCRLHLKEMSAMVVVLWRQTPYRFSSVQYFDSGDDFVIVK